MSWSPQQEQALRSVSEWLADDSGPQVFYLAGYAGTGKTTLAREIADQADKKTLFGAFTGKAASVLRRKGCRGAQTIHSMIYMIDEEEDDHQPDQPSFVLNPESEVPEAGLVIIDECSMVGKEVGQDLLSFGTRVLVIGDPAQLPPVKDAGFFTLRKPDFMLTEIHRQAADNPIIAMSMKIRAGEKFDIGNYGDCRIISRKDLSREDVMNVDQVIVGKNATRIKYNQRIREILEFTPGIPQREDKIICLKNDRKKKIFNGGMWRVIKCKTKKGMYNLDIVDDDDNAFSRDPIKKVTVFPEFFVGEESTLDYKLRYRFQEFTFGYAITCHKSQGSQWQNITVFNEAASFRDDARAWLYTAVTRAAEKLTLVQMS